MLQAHDLSIFSSDHKDTRPKYVMELEVDFYTYRIAFFEMNIYFQQPTLDPIVRDVGGKKIKPTNHGQIKRPKNTAIKSGKKKREKKSQHFFFAPKRGRSW